MAIRLIIIISIVPPTAAGVGIIPTGMRRMVVRTAARMLLLLMLRLVLRMVISASAGTVIHPPSRGGRRRILRVSRTARRVGTHGRTHGSAVGTAVPQAVYGKAEGFRPVAVAGEEVALLGKVMVRLLRLGVRIVRSGRVVVGMGGITSHEHAALLRLLNAHVRCTPMISVMATVDRRWTRYPAVNIGIATAATGDAPAAAGTSIVPRMTLELGGCAPWHLLVARSRLVGG